ncbi:sperm axonemal maintenance protein CFAP97D1 [Garra rufa]|uniref:sperm axonemal maintenance protein CFAP97D1 n=1 Tax=Garra rufa TaxID=137080 RepID=UPI003CCE64BE
MHKSYQPLKPATNKYLQHRWDQTRYDDHRSKVREAKPIVNTKGIQTPAHIQHKLKKIQVQEERMSIIERDNHLLASRLASISRSTGRVDHRNHYPECSLNAEIRRQKLLQVTHENQAIYQRITTQKSDYRRELWEGDWEKVERRRDDIARYPRGVSNKQQKSTKCVKFSGGTSGQSQSSSSGVEDDSGETTEDPHEHQTCIIHHPLDGNTSMFVGVSHSLMKPEKLKEKSYQDQQLDIAVRTVCVD